MTQFRMFVPPPDWPEPESVQVGPEIAVYEPTPYLRWTSNGLEQWWSASVAASDDGTAAGVKLHTVAKWMRVPTV